MEGPGPPSLVVDADVVTLRSQGHEVRFPRDWGRKFGAWLRGGRSRNVVCNADRRRFNLLGVSRVPGGLLFTYLEGSAPRALLLSPSDLAPLIPTLERED